MSLVTGIIKKREERQEILKQRHFPSRRWIPNSTQGQVGQAQLSTLRAKKADLKLNHGLSPQHKSIRRTRAPGRLHQEALWVETEATVARAEPNNTRSFLVIFCGHQLIPQLYWLILISKQGRLNLVQVMPNQAQSTVPSAVQTHTQTLGEGCNSTALKDITHLLPLLEVLDGFLVIFPPTSPP